MLHDILSILPFLHYTAPQKQIPFLHFNVSPSLSSRNGRVKGKLQITAMEVEFSEQLLKFLISHTGKFRKIYMKRQFEA